uniref:Mitoguardin 2 n=1 Tax=Rousettus aegyptiacus TaxID=9407 RepID=A0A7J8IP52_ROUAE|nr:mitoguardin 2 [Rousettus aegyptiacus]
MAFRRTEGMSMIQALAMTVAEIPVFLYTTFGQSAFSQLRLTPGLRKVLFATALGTVALALAAHQLKRRRRRKKQVGPEMGGEHLGTVPLPILMARKVPSMKKGTFAVSPSLLTPRPWQPLSCFCVCWCGF